MSESQPARGFSLAQSAAVIAMGVTVGCIPALQPILLGGLLSQHRLTAAQIGQAATAEAMGMALAMTLAAFLLKPDRLKPLALAAILAAVAANGATSLTEGFAIVLLRGVNGICSGLLLWILVGFTARAAAPGRVFAIYVTAQASLAFALSLLLSQWIVPAFGAAGGYALLTLADAMLLITLAFLPASYPAPAAGEARGAPPLAGVVALLGCGLFLAAIMAFWVYVIPMGRQLGHLAAHVGLAVNAAIGVQIVAGLAATALAARLRPLMACLAGAAAASLAIGAFLALPGDIVLYGALGVFSFTWMFVPPFQMPLLIEVDPSLRSALLIGSSQLFGVAAGPMLASPFVTDSDTLPAASVALACAGLGAALLLGSYVLRGARARRIQAA